MSCKVLSAFDFVSFYSFLIFRVIGKWTQYQERIARMQYFLLNIFIHLNSELNGLLPIFMLSLFSTEFAVKYVDRPCVPFSCFKILADSQFHLFFHTVF